MAGEGRIEVTLEQALDALAAECPWKFTADQHRNGQQRHVHLDGQALSCHSRSFVLALPDGYWRRSDAQAAYELILHREMKP